MHTWSSLRLLWCPSPWLADNGSIKRCFLLMDSLIISYLIMDPSSSPQSFPNSEWSTFTLFHTFLPKWWSSLKEITQHWFPFELVHTQQQEFPLVPCFWNVRFEPSFTSWRQVKKFKSADTITTNVISWLRTQSWRSILGQNRDQETQISSSLDTCSDGQISSSLNTCSDGQISSSLDTCSDGQISSSLDTCSDGQISSSLDTCSDGQISSSLDTCSDGQISSSLDTCSDGQISSSLDTCSDGQISSSLDTCSDGQISSSLDTCSDGQISSSLDTCSDGQISSSLDTCSGGWAAVTHIILSYLVKTKVHRRYHVDILKKIVGDWATSINYDYSARCGLDRCSR